MIMDPLVKYYIRQAGGGGRSDNGIGPIYISTKFVQRGHRIDNFLSALCRTVRPLLWSGTKHFGKTTLRALENEALHTGWKILKGIADNPQVSSDEIISKNATESLQNLSSKMCAQGRKHKRRPTSRNGRKPRRPSVHLHHESDGNKKAKTTQETSFLKVY